MTRRKRGKKGRNNQPSSVIKRSQIVKRANGVPDHFWGGPWFHAGVGTALATVFGFVASGADFLSAVSRLGFPFLLAVAGIAITFGMSPRIQTYLAGWERHAFRITILIAVVTCVVSYGMTIAREQADEEFLTLTQDRAPLDWANQTIHDRTLAGADLRRTIASNSNLRDVDLTDADLSGSDFNGAVFDRVDLSGARLCGVDARGANFRTAIGLEDVADFRFFVYDEDTVLPDGLDLSGISGAIATDRSSLLYSCEPGVTQVLHLAVGEE